MYPTVVQFEAGELQIEEQLAAAEAGRRARAASRPEGSRSTWLVRLARGVRPARKGARTETVADGLPGLPRSERRAIARLTSTVEYPAGSHLLRQGKLADSFFLIESGSAAVIRNERQLGELGPGDFFGELALLHEHPRTASVIATTDVRVRVIARHDFARAMQTLPTFASAVRGATRTRRPSRSAA